MPEVDLQADEALRLRFKEYNKSHRVSGTRTGSMLVALLMPFGFLLDYIVYPEEVTFFLFLRILCSAIAFGLYGLLALDFWKRFYRAFELVLFSLPSFFICLMIYYTEGIYSGYYAGLNLVLIGLSWAVRVSAWDSLLYLALTMLMYGGACYLHADGIESIRMLVNNYYFILLTGLIVVTGSYFLNKLRFREYAVGRQLEESKKELEASNLKLVEMDKAKTNFFANISHELRTPLTLLIGPLDRLRSPEGQVGREEQVELIDIMQQNAMRLMRLINDLLNLVRLDAGSLKLRPSEIELRPYLEGVCRSFYPMARDRKLEFSWEIDDGANPVVHLDREKVEKVLLNLLFNAIKFTAPGGSIALTAKRDGDLLGIDISDTGQGIAPDELESVFDRFWQSDSSSNRRYQGVGIGLSLVRDLAKLHGGGASARSELGVGTTMSVTFDVTVPVEPIKLEVVEDKKAVDTKWLEQLYRRAEFFPTQVEESAEEPDQAEQAETVEADRRPAILIADDEPEMMRFLKSQLKARYQIDEAHDGAEALEFAKKRRHHLVLLDYMMPEVDGIEATRRLRELDTHKGVPIVILTARADEESKFQALDAGATDFLTKPFSSTELLARCRNLASVFEMQQQIEEKTVRLEEALEQIKQTETQMVQQAKMASLGQLSAGLLHEVNNPLNFATTSIHLIKKRLTRSPHPEPELLEKPLTDLHDGIRRVSSIVSSLREFTHPDTTMFERVELEETINTAVRFVQIPANEITLRQQVESGASVRGNQNQLVHLFINLIQNSVDSLKDKGGENLEIRIDCSVVGDQIRLIFEDNGKGIPEDELERVFDAFFTTKKVGQGVGLGLSICHRIIQQHQGTVSVESEVDSFCRFTMSFPSYSREKTPVSV